MNVAYHAQALGADARPVTAVGSDELGREILRALEDKGLPTGWVSVDASKPTGTAAVEIAPDGQPHFTIRTDTAWDGLMVSEAAADMARHADAICFGSLAQRSEPARSSIRKLVAATPVDALRIFDVNLRQQYYSREVIETSLQLANVLKINDQELPVLADMLSLHGSAAEQLATLTARYDLRLTALTRGHAGSLLCLADGRCVEYPGLQVKVCDTIGAGDAFTAALALGLLAGWEPELISQRANTVAAFVVSQPGATPTLPEALTQLY